MVFIFVPGSFSADLGLFAALRFTQPSALGHGLRLGACACLYKLFRMDLVGASWFRLLAEEPPASRHGSASATFRGGAPRGFHPAMARIYERFRDRVQFPAIVEAADPEHRLQRVRIIRKRVGRSVVLALRHTGHDAVASSLLLVFFSIRGEARRFLIFGALLVAAMAVIGILMTKRLMLVRRGSCFPPPSLWAL